MIAVVVHRGGNRTEVAQTPRLANASASVSDSARSPPVVASARASSVSTAGENPT
ncbi:MAG: hypothetical protein ABI867_36020 [Kofleriaceae bacterium]